jgi:serine/threonine protein kinase
MIKPRLINEGTYGCIYHPGFKCNDEDEVDDVGGYATKIHSNINKSIVGNEIAISEKITGNIADYDLYLSPIIENCEVNLAKVSKVSAYEDVGKCKIISKDIKDKKSTTYVSTKMKYIEGNTLYKHVEQLVKTIKINTKIYEEIATLYKKICLGVDKLTQIRVVHFDLKENNIIVTKSGTPIIIDFGISIDMDKLLNKRNTTGVAKLLDAAFYAYSTDYSPWCIDIVLISDIVQKQKPNDKIKSSNVMGIFDEVMRKNKLASKIYLKEGLKIYREKFKQNIADKYNDTVNTHLLHDLLENYASWDLYSATLLFIEMLEKIKQNPNPNHVKQIKKNLGFME